MPTETLEFTKLSVDAQAPAKAHGDDAGYDLFSCTGGTIQPGETIKFSTGIAIRPPKGWYAQISERSSLGSKGIAVRGGVVDNGYRGNILVCLCNTGKEPYTVQVGDKIAQLVFKQYGNFEVKEVNSLDETARGEEGFGSSGR